MASSNSQPLLLLSSLLLLLPLLALALPPRVLVPKDTTWSLIAWGFNNGGKDSTSGMKLVNLDIDSQKSQIPSLRTNGNIVICYFSAGTLEPWRQDCQRNKTAWQRAAVGKMDGWYRDESWLDVRKLQLLQDLLAPRFQRAAQQGCHGIEPDNIDCYQNEDCWGGMTNPSVSSGSAIKPQQLAFNKWMASYARSLGLVIAQKNAVGLIPSLVSDYDFAINEQCQQYSECGAYSAYVQANKAVFNVEYSSRSSYCQGGKSNGLMTKYCSGSDGKCTSGSWTNCFNPSNPLPPTRWNNSTSA